ncbi:dihydrolipoamide acetyltransferase family protein [Oceanobacillus iheyensis]|uniref:Dihydrolipoamide acetyltransferase component of pyruvate dehydrogenase complex n=1 Tax=Oceanobacillus iheyensis (strain DSM 14371 / CIP 107618 / JCM 11309 / KCTC 3954 / HTE831) TaxID=221109 RepID=Q8CX89_OCEIH|nr:dihydrolipoamide acetyltransferase family protein [Oceanobacillus iheyensis]BAC14831.1 pyruvate dehydrogenase E2 (dihydrolipoamide acetyltransferase) [Oceanobacillus iheyensis HTE831]
MVEVKLHDIGEGMTEGDILTYFIQEGDQVEEDQPIVEMQTEKMVAEITAPAKGTVKEIFIAEGTTISVGTTIMTIESEDAMEKTKSSEIQRAEGNQATQLSASDNQHTETKQKNGPKRIKASPYTRKVARELDVDIELVEGTGKDGRIMIEDVQQFSQNRESAATKVKPEVEQLQNQFFQETEEQVDAKEEEAEIIPFKGRRKQIAKKMTTSIYTIPHVHHMEEVDMTELLEFRKEIKSDADISVAAFFIKALTIALKEYPIFNAKLHEEKEEIRLEKGIHMGIATDTEEGLIVPVIQSADIKSIRTIHREMKELMKKAKENTLSLKEMTGSTFTISNVGPMGSIGATPIINYPEVALMAFHKTKKAPVVNDNDEIVIRSMMNVTLTFDHRVTDGGNAIAFTNKFKALIENPRLLLIELR